MQNPLPVYWCVVCGLWPFGGAELLTDTSTQRLTSLTATYSPSAPPPYPPPPPLRAGWNGQEVTTSQHIQEIVNGGQHRGCGSVVSNTLLPPQRDADPGGAAAHHRSARPWSASRVKTMSSLSGRGAYCFFNKDKINSD